MNGTYMSLSLNPQTSNSLFSQNQLFCACRCVCPALSALPFEHSVPESTRSCLKLLQSIHLHTEPWLVVSSLYLSTSPVVHSEGQSGLFVVRRLEKLACR